MPLEQQQNEHDALARQTLIDGTSFLRAVTQIADKREVVASEDIFSQTGIKLVTNGTQLSGVFYDRLIAHKLLRPIEQSLTVADALDAKQLVTLFVDEARHFPALERAVNQSERFARFAESFGHWTIPAPLALKLSVMQEDRPELFQHSLTVAMLCALLGVLGEFSPERTNALTLAGVFHDIGELSLDPAMLAPGHHMDTDERRYLFTHPITGYLMLREFAEIPRETALAVWQHHERADGTGYPYRLHGEQIDVLSRNLAVAEFVASLLKRNGVNSRINIKLRLNLNKFDADAVGIMCSLFSDTEAAGVPLPDETLLIARLTQVGRLFEGWQFFRSTLSPAAIDEIAYFDERMDSLRMMVLEPGFDQCQLEDLLPKEGRADSEIREELTVLLDEVAWQMQDLANALEHKLAARGWSLPVSRRPDFLSWMAQVRAFSGQ